MLDRQIFLSDLKKDLNILYTSKSITSGIRSIRTTGNYIYRINYYVRFKNIVLSVTDRIDKKRNIFGYSKSSTGKIIHASHFGSTDGL